MQYKSLQEIQKTLMSGETNMVSLVNYYLSNIKSTISLNAYVEVYEGEALEKAALLDAKIKDDPKSLGCLFGSVISVKDLIVQKDHQVSASSQILKGFESQFTASALEAILQQDAIVIGRTNCDEFGMGSANTNSCYGHVKNANDITRISGGSSGGAAVSVQTDTCLVALGTDTGGSVRQPASMCGVFGYKPSYGLVSRYGLIAYASSFDQLGLLAKNPEDIDAFMQVASFVDGYDATIFRSGLYKDQEETLPSDIKVAYFSETLSTSALDPEIKESFLQKLNALEKQNIDVSEISFDFLDYLVPCYYILTTAEASSNLSRYDGVRYGYRSPNATTLEQMYVMSRTEAFGHEVKKRIMLGSFVLSEAYFDAYFTKAQQVRQMIKTKMEELFETYDYILMPTSPEVAWPIDAKPTDPLAGYMADIYTVLANLTGIPAISVPLGNNLQNLPFGMQIFGKIKNDRQLINFARKI